MERRKRNLILLSKIQAPQIKTKTLKRQHLLDLLARNLNKKVILLCAGAGYGKTTLLSQFISSKKIPYVYYQLEKDDAEPVVFFSYLVAGIRKIKPRFGKKIEALSRFFNYPQRYLDIIVGTFINEIIENIKDDFYLILEDYHSLEQSANVDKILTYLLTHIPARLHIIITSRATPSVSLARLRARGEILELKTHHLRFTKYEILSLFKEMYAIPLKESELKWIEEHSEGWPTSLRLMIQSADYLEGVKSSGYVRRVLDSYYQSQHNLFNYFAQEIYNQESNDVKQFLVDCSVLEWLTPGLCDMVTRRKNSVRVLSSLTARNAFLFRIPGQGFRFHNLYRDFLRSKFTDINKERRIYKRAGNFYHKEQKLEEALKFYLKAAEYKKSASIIEKIGFDITERGRTSVLCSYIEQIPNSLRNRRAELIMTYAQGLIHVGRSDEAKSNYLRAAKIFKKKKNKLVKYADALYELGGISLNQSKFRAAKRWFEMALDVCPRQSTLTRAGILNSLGFVYTEIGGKRLEEAPRYFQKALRIAQRNQYKDVEASILNNWAMSEWRAGNLNQAWLRLSKMVKLLKEDFTPHCGAGFYNASRLSLLLGHKKEARSMLDAGIKTCGPYNDVWSMGALWKGYALLFQELGDFEKARQFIVKSLEIYERLGIVMLIITALNELCKINIATNDLSEAEKNISDIWWFKKNKDDAEAIVPLLTEAKLRIVHGKFGTAEDILLEALRLAQRVQHIFNTFLIYIELSRVYHLQGKDDKALSALTQAIEISHAKGYDYLLSQELQKDEWMLEMTRRENIEKRYIISVIKTSKLDIHWVDASLFGRPKVLIDDCTITDRSWKTIKAKKLFFYLVLHKNEAVSNDSLIDIFWHNSSYSTGRYNVRKTIQYIRYALKNILDGKDLIVSSKGLYQISPKASIWLDLDRFEDLVKNAQQVKKEDKQLEDSLHKALSVYKDGFAPDWYDSWVEEKRRYYQSLYEDCLLMMSDLCFRRRKFKEALVLYQKLLALNFYNEEYHRKVIMTYARLGRHRDIKHDFERLKESLKNELGTEPQPETVSLYKKLVPTS